MRTVAGTSGVNLLIQFLYLQVLDVLTTLAFLLNGAPEGNPIVRTALRVAPSPLVGLLTIKILAAFLAWYCIRRSRLRLLARMNILFASLVAWNLIVILLTSPAIRSLG